MFPMDAAAASVHTPAKSRIKQNHAQPYQQQTILGKGLPFEMGSKIKNNYYSRLIPNSFKQETHNKTKWCIPLFGLSYKKILFWIDEAQTSILFGTTISVPV